MILYFLITVLLLIILWLILLHFKKQIIEEVGFTNYFDNGNVPEYDNLDKCQVPTLNTEQCYKSRFYECPIVNGSYLQCTNNYIPKPAEYNADCGNRTFDMVPYPWKISENCYYDKIGFNRDMTYGKVHYRDQK